jgi:hypothetical protein
MKTKITALLFALAAALTVAGAYTIKNDSAYGRVVRPDSGKLLKLSGADACATAVYVAASVTDAQIAALVTEVPAVEIAQAASKARAEQQIARLASTDAVEWVAGETGALGAKRLHGGQEYSVIQAHITQAGWEPSRVPALWKLEQTPGADGTPAAWVQPTGGHDAYALGALVSYSGTVWRSLVNANVWPPAEGTLWTSGTAQ